jgi:hypothetical protein
MGPTLVFVDAGLASPSSGGQNEVADWMAEANSIAMVCSDDAMWQLPATPGGTTASAVNLVESGGREASGTIGGCGANTDWAAMDSRLPEQTVGRLTTFLSAAVSMGDVGVVQPAPGTSEQVAMALPSARVGSTGLVQLEAQAGLLGLVPPANEGVVDKSAGSLSRVQASAKMAQIPLSFEVNEGQADASVRFVTHGPGFGFYLTETGAVMVLDAPSDRGNVANLPGELPGVGAAGWKPAPRAPATVVSMQVLGSNPSAAVVGEEPLPNKVHYFLGNDPSHWHTNIATYSKVEYRQVYPGIDLEYYGRGQGLEYDFVVAAGADPGVIRLGFAGVDGVEVNAQGDLVVHAAGQDLIQPRPLVYQEVNGARQEIGGAFLVQDDAREDALAPRELRALTRPGSPAETLQVGFQLAAYDRNRPLVIDPVLSYSTYLGGSGWDEATGLAVDPATGDALVTGWTNSADFPTANPLQGTNRGIFNAFVARLSPDGSALIYSTYLGGSIDDESQGIGVDPTTGDAVVAGYTYSTDFPTINPLQPTNRGEYNAFVARLSPDGSALVYSTYLGGSIFDAGFGIAVDPTTGEALVTGNAFSKDFPTANALQPTNHGFCNAFVARLSADGSRLVYSTYLGGSGGDYGFGIAVDPTTGDALVTGSTTSTNFPTANPLQVSNHGGFDAFVARLSAEGSYLVYSTYLGGSGEDYGQGIAVDPTTGDALVTGYTTSRDFPAASPLALMKHFIYTAFVARLSAEGSALVYSTYLGGSDKDDGKAIAVDPITGDALVTGTTFSTDFPTVNPLQSTNHGGEDVFVARLSAVGRALVFSTYLGGSDHDAGTGIAVDPSTGDTLVTGWTLSTDFPTANALQPTNHSRYNAFVARIS